MKTLLAITLLLSFSLQAFCQNWALIHPDKQYFFKLNNTDSILEVIRVDSSDITGTDTLYHLNRLTKYNSATSTYQAYLSTLIGTEVLPRQSEYLLYHNGWKTYHFRDSLQSPWLFDTANNISAFISSMDSVTLFGSPDSLMTVQFSNGDSQLISKNFGLLNVPLTNGNVAKLAGYKDSVAHGDFLPGYREIFDFNIGDVLEYEYSSGDGSIIIPGVAIHWYGIHKCVITDRVNMTDSINYTVHMTSNQYIDYYMGTHGTMHTFTSDKQVTFSELETDFAGAIPYTPTPISSGSVDVNNGIPFKEIGYPCDTAMQLITMWGSAGIYQKEVTSANNVVPNSTDTFVNASDCLITLSKRYIQGLGMTHFFYEPFETYAALDLIAYIKNGDTTGHIYSDNEILLGIPNTGSPNPVSIYPNPSNTYCLVNFNQNCSIKVCNALGVEVMAFEYIKGQTQRINTAELPAGLYFIQLINAEGTLSKEFIVAH